MRERPILFSTPMVRAILSGTKTQTRRIIRPQPGAADPDARGCFARPVLGHGVPLAHVDPQRRFGIDAAMDHHGEARSQWIPCPFGAPGDRLWVRETWCRASDDAIGESDPQALDGRPRGPEDPDTGLRPFVYYRATDDFVVDSNDEERSPWKSPIFMPRWASRILLQIKSVGFQRVQSISDDDARAEGVDLEHPVECVINGEKGTVQYLDARTAFAHLWCHINGNSSWTSNPWVWVVTFERLKT